ncbi:MAG: D-alanyl-D-alanine carboxypeptidase [Patescibacteria group bacterium]|nr:D-alanyl-D-alanine carboxypeptidase [Patescibacteria group bacterium]MDE2172808.1 D-alanyl-D-alanine carboxypeptidase [Patescibacteria group bacterium]
MRQFLTLVFGGLTAVAAGIGLVYGAISLVRLAPAIPGLGASKISLSSVADAIMPYPTDGTSISGIARTVRWSASQEEDQSGFVPPLLPIDKAGRVTAAAYIVRDLSDPAVPIMSRDPDRLLPIASLSKLVTAVMARRLIPSAAHITMSPSIISSYGNTAGFMVDETISAGDLIYPLLMVSSNEAAEAYAAWYGRPAFIAAMNDFAQSIGAYRTYFADPSGLSPQNVSTANDMAIILDWIRKNDPDLISITQLKSKTVRGHAWVNPTHFLSWSDYLGGKNGYTPEADLTAASLFRAGAAGDVYAVVVLGSSARDLDEFTLLSKLQK